MRPIDADELSKTIKETCLLAKPWDYVLIERTIADAPTIEPERKTGRWIYHDDDDMRFDTYHCSECKKLFTVDAERFYDIGFVKEDLKFCPNCGADMRGGAADE